MDEGKEVVILIALTKRQIIKKVDKYNSGQQKRNSHLRVFMFYFLFAKSWKLLIFKAIKKFVLNNQPLFIISNNFNINL